MHKYQTRSQIISPARRWSISFCTELHQHRSKLAWLSLPGRKGAAACWAPEPCHEHGDPKCATSTETLSHQQPPAAPGRAWLGEPPGARAGLNCWSQLFPGALALAITFTAGVKDSSTESLTQKLLILLSSRASQDVANKPNQKSKHKLKWPETYREILLDCFNELKWSSDFIYKLSSYSFLLDWC